MDREKRRKNPIEQLSLLLVVLQLAAYTASNDARVDERRCQYMTHTLHPYISLRDRVNFVAVTGGNQLLHCMCIVFYVF